MEGICAVRGEFIWVPIRAGTLGLIGPISIHGSVGVENFVPRKVWYSIEFVGQQGYY